MRLTIPLTDDMRVALLDRAARERRTPQQEAARLLERALLPVTSEAEEGNHAEEEEPTNDY